jgi:hypothetical protein
MKKVKVIIMPLFLAAALLVSQFSFTQSEQCTAEIGGNGRCVPLIGPNGILIGFFCAPVQSGEGFPCNH